ncbi:hypothetical protein NFC81_06955 [Salinispirillum sp. LH 10-3-1]|uniref:DUF488 family protein n=1 Tax=Salinispirillum sp. LH 10-3-1 TaxID=2952525 RepID=A0AB38YJP0_9GAMM
MLRQHRVEIHLYGYLDGRHLPFVDVSRSAAVILANTDIPPGFTFIYAYPMSGQACILGDKDPLQVDCDDLAERLRVFRPPSYSEETYDKHLPDLLEQAEYLRQFPPTRLVYVGKGDLCDQALQAWLGALSS